MRNPLFSIAMPLGKPIHNIEITPEEGGSVVGLVGYVAKLIGKRGCETLKRIIFIILKKALNKFVVVELVGMKLVM